MNLETFKGHFSQTNEFIHLNNSGQSLIPDVNRDTAIKWINRIYKEAAFCAMDAWNQGEVTRKKLAHFLGADVSEVSYFTTTASALSQAAFGIPLQKGDEILTWDQEYPSNFYPWRMAAEKSQAKVIQVESVNWETPADKILSQVTSKTKVIAVSWVQYISGSVTDLKLLSDKLKDSGIWLVADVIQGVGVRPFNFKDSGFDIICGGSHKFLCSGYGASYMVIKKDRIPQLTPLEYGAMTFGNPDTPKSFSNQIKSDGARYEPGTKAMVEIIALGATLDLFQEFGVDNIAKEANRLAKKLADGLKNSGYGILSQENSAIINVLPKSNINQDQMAEKLTQAKVSFAKRGPGIRLSTHAFNRDSEIEKVISILS